MENVLKSSVSDPGCNFVWLILVIFSDCFMYASNKPCFLLHLPLGFRSLVAVYESGDDHEWYIWGFLAWICTEEKSFWFQSDKILTSVLFVLTFGAGVWWNQCWGSESGSTCLWASLIRIRIISQRYGSGSFKNSMKNLDFNCFVTSIWRFTFENWWKRTLNKWYGENLFFV
jgi:hypothetical protein